ncbi:MAG: SDR family oxidoreductase [Planctomycetota bacterium]
MAALDGKRALVTGGTRGIGLATARALAAAGARVAITWFRSRTDAEAAQAALRGNGVDPLLIRANAGNPDHVVKAFDQVASTFGGLDLYVANAATGALKPLLDASPRDFDLAMEVNARSFLLSVQKAASLMTGGGAVVALTTHGARRVIPDYGLMGAAKAAIESLVRYFAVELAPRGIRVNAVSAGIVDTASLRGFPDVLRIKTLALVRTPSGRMGTPEEIADAVAFLCTDAARWVTGQTLEVDGGYTLAG